MISRSSMRVGTHIARAMGSKQLSNPHPTIFDDSIRYLIPGLANRRNITFEDAVSGVEAAAQAVDDHGYSAQEVALQDSVELLMAAQGRQFQYVRDTVLPFIGQVSADVLERIKDAEPKEPTVVEWKPSNAVLEPAVRELLKSYTQKTVVTRMIATATESDDAELMQRLKTGLPVVDDAIAATITALGDGVVRTVYNALFRGIWNQQGCPIGAELYRVFQKNEAGGWVVLPFHRQYVDLALLTYFMVDSLVDQPLNGTGLTLSEYEGVMLNLRNAVGGAARQSLVNYDNDLRYGQLIIKAPAVSSASVLRFDSDDAVILVHGDVYAKFLAQGGNPEAIIGGCLARTPETYLAKYVANMKAYHAQYHNAVKERDDFVRRSIGVRIAQAIVTAVQTRLNDIPSVDLPAAYSKDAAVAKVTQEVNGSVYTLTESWDTQEAINVYGAVEGLVSAFVFDFVDAKTIIDLINESYARINSEQADVEGGDIDTSAAVWMAFMQYLAKWCIANFPTAK